MGPDGRDHCHHYVDRNDPAAAIRDEPGTFTRLERGAAWCRALGLVARAVITGKKASYQRGTAGNAQRLGSRGSRRP